jgi:threonine aldolase
MDNSIIDMRSDTVTKPTVEMRAAMAAAEVGDDVYLEDPTVNRLQQRAAEMFGKEASLFVPSGTMGNQIAVRLHTTSGQEVITERMGHIFNYELAAMAAISGVLARPVAAPDGILDWDLIRPAIAPKIYYRAQTGLITLENTHNMAGGTVYTAVQIDDICRCAHEAGIPVHLDGARIFNAAVAQGLSARELAEPVDSVTFCLSKGLSAPVGSVLCGKAEFIKKAHRVRKQLGGGMRQAGILAAAGVVALETMVDRLADDHKRARYLVQGLSFLPWLVLDPGTPHTNMIFMSLAENFPADSKQVADEMAKKGVKVGVVGTRRFRLVTHCWIDDAAVDKAIVAFQEAGLKLGPQ